MARRAVPASCKKAGARKTASPWPRSSACKPQQNPDPATARQPATQAQFLVGGVSNPANPSKKPSTDFTDATDFRRVNKEIRKAGTERRREKDRLDVAALQRLQAAATT